MINIQNNKKNEEENNSELKKEEFAKIQEIISQLEKELYYRNKFKNNAKSNYEMDIKTLASFLKKDKSGYISLQLLSGAFSISTAAELR